MRKPLGNSNRVRTNVSLDPVLKVLGNEKAKKEGVSFSEYLNNLIKFDVDE